MSDLDNQKTETEAVSDLNQNISKFCENILKSIGDGLIVVDKNLKIIFINSFVEKFCLVNKQEVINKNVNEVFKLVNAITLKPIVCPFLKAIEKKETVGLEHNTVLVLKNNEKKFLSASCSPIIDEHDKVDGAVMVFRDISYRKALEEELLKASKLESLGYLAAGIAHDFNNLLAGIIGNISYAKFLVIDNQQAIKALDIAEETAFKAKELTSKFRIFSKGSFPFKKKILINDLIKNIAGSILCDKNKILPIYELNDELWAVEGDEGQIYQAIANIILNSVTAMKNNGKLIIKSSNVEINESTEINLINGKYVRIDIIDEGEGISADNISKVFEPYFTTWSGHSGLGLTVSYSIIRKHGGTIILNSVLNKGTQVSIYLPAFISELEIKEKRNINVSRKYKILIMDDENIVREVTANLLKHFGYEILTAKNGTEAIECIIKAENENKPFDVIILDLFVPGDIGGVEVLQRLNELGFNKKAIAISGYSDSKIMAEFQQHGFKAAISKPCKIKELDELLQNIILS